MAHEAQRQFCARIKEKYLEHFVNALVLDCGSLDVKGNNRWLFDKAGFYHGIDVVPGKNVDEVCSVLEYSGVINSFDIVISTEMLEHDPDWRESTKRMVELLKPGGLLIITCATGKRKIHHTPPGGYYGNVARKSLLKALTPDILFSKWEVEIGRKNKDLYFAGIKK